MSKESALSKKNIKGKRIRSQVFYNTFAIIVTVLVFFVFCVAIQVPSDFMLLLQIITPMALMILFAVLFSFKTVLCILDVDKLYFFNEKGIEFITVSSHRKKY